MTYTICFTPGSSCPPLGSSGYPQRLTQAAPTLQLLELGDFCSPKALLLHVLVAPAPRDRSMPRLPATSYHGNPRQPTSWWTPELVTYYGNWKLGQVMVPLPVVKFEHVFGH